MPAVRIRPRRPGDARRSIGERAPAPERQPSDGRGRPVRRVALPVVRSALAARATAGRGRARGQQPGIRHIGDPGERIDTVDLPEVEGASAVTSGRVATILREAREARGLTVSDASKATRIWERYLHALEANAPLQEFPAPVYARSFLRAYAEFLELDTDSIVRRFDEDHPVPEDPILEPLPVLRPRRRAFAGALVVVSVLALLAMAAARLQSDRADGPEVSPPPARRRVARSEATR